MWEAKQVYTRCRFAGPSTTAISSSSSSKRSMTCFLDPVTSTVSFIRLSSPDGSSWEAGLVECKWSVKLWNRPIPRAEMERPPDLSSRPRWKSLWWFRSMGPNLDWETWSFKSFSVFDRGAFIYRWLNTLEVRLHGGIQNNMSMSSSQKWTKWTYCYLCCIACSYNCNITAFCLEIWTHDPCSA